MRASALILLLLSGCPLDDSDERIRSLESERDALRVQVANLQRRLDANAARGRLNRINLETCLEFVEADYWNQVKLNGGRERKDKPGVWNARAEVFRDADRAKQIAMNKCNALYGAAQNSN